MKHFFLVSLPFVIYSLLNFISQLLHGTTGATQNHGTWAIIVIAVHLGLIAALPIYLAQLRKDYVLCKI